MKKLVYLLSIVFLASCTTQSSDYAKVSGLIANNSAKEVSIISKGYKKVIKINLDGSFSDTLKIVNKGLHTFYDGKNKLSIFINNGNAINFNYDYAKTNETMQVDGIGAETTNFLVEEVKFITKEKLKDTKSFYKLDKDVFNTRVSFLESEVNNMLASPKIDKSIKDRKLANYKRVFDNLKQSYQRQKLADSSTGVGKPSPTFNNYENYKGGKSSLKDFKGKYVYVDVWATWCGPCKQQIPFLQELEKKYHNKNIEFVSISVDNGRGFPGKSLDAAKKGWRKMIKDKKMGGTQLFADKAWSSDFVKGYGIRGIPRFILIDPNGNIVNANAPRPSQQSLKDLLNGLNL